MEFFLFITSVFAAILIIEGLLYALFTKQIRLMLLRLFAMEDREVKAVGVSMALIGVLLLFVLSWMGA